jgi:serine/threonine protein kinase
MGGGIGMGVHGFNPRKPFSLWKNIDADFKDLVSGLTNFEPTKRLTAHEALAHRWFSDV